LSTLFRAVDERRVPQANVSTIVFSGCVFLRCRSRLFAQTNFAAQLRGTIQDASGALLPGARVTLTNTATNTRAENTSDSAGRYIFADLQPATYDLTFEAKGFRKLVESAVELRVTSNRRSLSPRKSALSPKASM